MKKLMTLTAVAALTTVGAAPVLAQAADPFVSTQGENRSGLSDEQIAAIAAGLVLGVALLFDDDGNIIGTTSTTTSSSSSSN